MVNRDESAQALEGYTTQGVDFVFFNKNLAGDNVPSGDVKAAFTKLNKVFIKWNVCTTLL